jgi:hypothetical protein
MDLSSSPCEGNFVHRQFHQVDAAPVSGWQVFDRQRVRNIIGIESTSLISDDNKHAGGPLAAATDINQLASFQAIAVEHCVTHGFPKRDFNELLLAGNRTGSSD